MAISYKDSGVDVTRGYKAVDLMKKYVKTTYNDNVLGDIGSFGGFYSISGEKMEEPVLVAGTDGIQKLLAIDEFKDAQAGLNFQGTGKLCTPLGATLVHVPGMAAGKIIALDKSCALEMVQSGDICVDSGKLIDRQLDEISISATAGFARIFSGAAQGVSYTTE